MHVNAILGVDLSVKDNLHCTGDGSLLFASNRHLVVANFDHGLQTTTKKEPTEATHSTSPQLLLTPATFKSDAPPDGADSSQSSAAITAVTMMKNQRYFAVGLRCVDGTGVIEVWDLIEKIPRIILPINTAPPEAKDLKRKPVSPSVSSTQDAGRKITPEILTFSSEGKYIAAILSDHRTLQIWSWEQASWGNR